MNILHKRVLTTDECCELLGLKKSYVYKLTASGILPFSKPNGGKMYFDREKLEAWMLSNPSISRIERQQIAATYVTTH